MTTQSPDERVASQWRKLQLIKKKSTGTYRKLVRELCKNDIWFLIRVVLRWGWLDETLHGEELTKFLDDNAEEEWAVFIPRGHGKTLVLAAARIIQRILKFPNIAILFASATEDLADGFGQLVGNILLNNEILQECFDDILPKGTQDSKLWGKDGYSLPKREPRIDPTLRCISMKSTVGGFHPDEIHADDLIGKENNNAKGWDTARRFLKEAKMLVPAQGRIYVTGTRWDDKDPYADIISGRILGKSGRRFKTLIMSCWRDDDRSKPPIYPRAKRWDMETETGYTGEQLESMRAAEDEGGLGVYFDAQMRNDPAPEDRADIKVSDLVIYDKADLPPLTDIRAMGVETTGGGKPIYNALLEKTEKLRLFLPLVEISPPRTRGETKTDRIKGTLEPIVREGRLHVQDWMRGEATSLGTLGYEIRRLGAASHDDILDALASCISHLVRGVFPSSESIADLYVCVDLAYTEEKRSDSTVALALAVDHKKNYWVVDYDRFQISSPSALCERLIEFYRKWSPEEDAPTTDRFGSGKRKFNLALSYK